MILYNFDLDKEKYGLKWKNSNEKDIWRMEGRSRRFLGILGNN